MHCRRSCIEAFSHRLSRPHIINADTGTQVKRFGAIFVRDRHLHTINLFQQYSHAFFFCQQHKVVAACEIFVWFQLLPCQPYKFPQHHITLPCSYGTVDVIEILNVQKCTGILLQFPLCQQFSAGFVDAAGAYHETEFYRAFKYGGIFFLDEFDASDPTVAIALNGAIANRYFAFPEETVHAHPDFRVVAAGNTLGTGRDAVYTGRMQLDAASLNRFATIPVGYDSAIDSYCAKGDGKLIAFINQYRQAAAEAGIPSVAAYRNIKMIKVYEPVMLKEQVLMLALTKDLGADDINALIGTGRFIGDNPWLDALENIPNML